MPRQPDAPYNLDVYVVEELRMLQVYVAGTNNISVVEHVKNLDGSNFFQMTADILAEAEEVTEDDEELDEKVDVVEPKVPEDTSAVDDSTGDETASDEPIVYGETATEKYRLNDGAIEAQPYASD